MEKDKKREKQKLQLDVEKQQFNYIDNVKRTKRVIVCMEKREGNKNTDIKKDERK